jgi:hypothetical protein
MPGHVNVQLQCCGCKDIDETGEVKTHWGRSRLCVQKASHLEFGKVGVDDFGNNGGRLGNLFRRLKFQTFVNLKLGYYQIAHVIVILSR